MGERKQGEQESEKQAPSEQGARCRAQSMDPGIKTWAKGSSLINWATQTPLFFTFWSSFILMILSVIFPIFILLRTSWDFWICSCMSFTKFSAIISLNSFSSPTPFLPSSNIKTFNDVPQFSEYLFIFFNFLLCVSALQSSWFLSVHLRICWLFSLLPLLHYWTQ